MIGPDADIKVYESRRSVSWLWAALCAGIFVILLFTVSDLHRAKDAFSGWVGLFATVFGVFYFVNQARHPPRIRIQTQALIIERPGRGPTVVPWNQIDSFVVVRRRGLELLGYRLRKGVGKSPMASLSRFWEGADAVIYGFWPEKAKLMTSALTIYLKQLQDLNAPLDRNPAIVAAPSSAPNPAPVYTHPPKQAAFTAAPPAVSEPRRLFARKPKTDETGNKPIVW